MSPLQPLSPGERDTSLDLLRGFALAGVLLTFCITDVRSSPGYAKTLFDQLIDWPKWILVESRMYTMLIIIFGIGFHVQLRKAQQKGVSLVPVFLRRLTGLILLGFLHAIFLSTRDILIFYGVAGIVLLLLRNAKSWQLWTVMGFLFIAVSPFFERFSEGYKAFQLTQPNNYADHLKHNWQFFKLYHQVYYIYFEMIIHFMFGYIVGRAGLLQQITSNKNLRRKLMVLTLIGSAVLIPVYYFYFPARVFPVFREIKSQAILYLAAMGVRLTWQLWMIVSVVLYTTLLLGAYQSIKRKRWLILLASFGQMSLSNYLIQSILLVPYLLAFDKYNNMPPFIGFLLFLCTLTLQLVFSRWWMTKYTMGPFEWLLRSFTYWRWQKIKRPEPLPQTIQLLPIQK